LKAGRASKVKRKQGKKEKKKEKKIFFQIQSSGKGTLKEMKNGELNERIYPILRGFRREPRRQFWSSFN